MKKLLLLALSFGLLMSCKKDDENGIPPVDPNKPQPEKPQDKPATALEVKNLKAADYEKFRDSKEKVKLHGEIAEVKGNWSYFKFSDGTLVQIFTHKFKELKEETSQKLKTVGQELTVVGVFTDYSKDGTPIKEILYESEADLTFGKTPESKPEQPVVALEVKNLKAADYDTYRDKKEKVKLHGEIAEVTNGRSYFKFSDGSLVQIFTHKFKELKEETSQKLKTVGQELTVVGVFTDHKLKNGSIVKEIVYESEADLTFGTTPQAKPTPNPEQPVVTLEASRATVNDFEKGKAVKIHGNITVKKEGKYNRSYFKFSDGTLIQFYVKNYDKTLSAEVRTKLETEGQEVTVKGKFNTFTKTDKKTGVKTDIRQIEYESAADLTF
ncbi:hypothetical protein [uncultured Capnocytophaga sp.]|uniref:hypothetical protein n=1 Tax=uncultured Capnocytophaga sp. TaxID=159273 RepID=UPI00262456C3|nr:hypothetical protein [uncultured Capnocytophaga sp.]